MQIGIVSHWDLENECGRIVSSEAEFSFNYRDGRSIVSSSQREPRLSAAHDQGEGFELKQPRIGDAIVFLAVPAGDVERWGYAEHYVNAAIRHFGSDFVAASSVE